MKKNWQIFLLAAIAILLAGLTMLAWNRRPMAQRANEYQFHFVIESGFVGKLDATEDPSITVSKDLEYTLVQEGHHVRVPVGFLVGGGYSPYRVLSVSDKKGNRLSTGVNPPTGQIGVRTLQIIAGPADDNPDKIVQKYVFVVDKVQR